MGGLASRHRSMLKRRCSGPLLAQRIGKPRDFTDEVAPAVPNE